MAKVLLVCGGRDYDDHEAAWSALAQVLARHPDITTIRHGDARGADSLAADFAEREGLLNDPWPADWEAHGKAAGPRRNAEMLTVEPVPFACVAFPGGQGTADMVRRCRAAGVPVWDRRADAAPPRD